MADFMFATGIENSYPVISLPDGAMKRVDEMEKTRHYQCYKQDFALVKELGIAHLRWGPPYFKTHIGPGKYDWSFADEALDELRRLRIVPIVDLCHFGVPDWLGNFQNPEWPEFFAEYAAEFAKRYRWVHLYTPVNEISVAARFSALYGWWNERKTDHGSYVTALKHLCKANVLAMRAILAVQSDETFIQSESSEYFHAEDPSCEITAGVLNEGRFLALDLTYGYPVSFRMYEYLLENGMSKEELHWFTENQVSACCVMGNDYYVTNEHLVHPDGTTSWAGEVFGYYVITKQYYDRYKLPVMHTETNIAEPEAVSFLKRQWANLRRLRLDGVPIIGFTWYSLTDQVDWDTALREDNGRVNPLGLYDLDRKIRPVGEAYRDLIAKWRDVIPEDCLSESLAQALISADPGPPAPPPHGAGEGH